MFGNLVESHPRNIPTNFEENVASSSGEEVENVHFYRQMDGRVDRRQRMESHCIISSAD